MAHDLPLQNSGVGETSPAVEQLSGLMDEAQGGVKPDPSRYAAGQLLTGDTFVPLLARSGLPLDRTLVWPLYIAVIPGERS